MVGFIGFYLFCLHLTREFNLQTNFQFRSLAEQTNLKGFFFLTRFSIESFTVKKKLPELEN